MRAHEQNPRFTNKLVHATSPYLKQHAHNPVFWYEWGDEAFALARQADKPILLSIGYSTCYWCHVMEREVFENPSIAALMNAAFINIKLDREERPDLDEMYMVARQLMTHEGGWPNNLFLTPQLKPFYAGGTFGPDDAYGKPGFPRLIEWLNHAWLTQRDAVERQAEETTIAMRRFLVFAPQGSASADIAGKAQALSAKLAGFHDARAGGFFQAPKFPHECFLQFLLAWHAQSGSIEALNIAAHSLGKMAAGGIYDQVGCGFHRYAVDKEWYVPHFEKMLYTQAMLARLYTDAFTATGNQFFADIAKGILDFTSGPLTDGNGAFYSAIDAETDGVEGAYYAWRAEEIQSLLTPEETQFFVHAYALADIPAYPGHKHVDGQALIARKPFDQLAVEMQLPYVQVAAMAGHIMNKLLVARNLRVAPGLDDKIITSWNGLMIDAYAHAGKALGQPRYTAIAQRAADYLLEHAIDNESRLCHVITQGKAHIPALLEDYAYLVKGLLPLAEALPQSAYLAAAQQLMARAQELFGDSQSPAFFSTQPAGDVLVRMQLYEDSTLPCANAVMMANMARLGSAGAGEHWRTQAQAMADYFLQADLPPQPESASMLAAALQLLAPQPTSRPLMPVGDATNSYRDALAYVHAEVVEEAAQHRLQVQCELAPGWHVYDPATPQPDIIALQIDAHAPAVQLGPLQCPPARMLADGLQVHEGRFTISADIVGKWEKGALRVLIRFQPCSASACHSVRDISLIL
jgi:uncharacterized protein YyaL (SSP411 family)